MRYVKSDGTIAKQPHREAQTIAQNLRDVWSTLPVKGLKNPIEYQNGVKPMRRGENDS